jgi:outer membrane protein OmpA-like peptidoglycan-associated protein
MDARLVPAVLVALGLADVCALNLVLCPRLTARPPASAPAALPDCPPPSPEAKVDPRPRADAPPSEPAGARAATSSASLVSAPAAAPAVDDVVFEISEDRVGSPAAVNEIRRVACEMMVDPTRKVLLRGHADRLGTPRQNLDLSRRRAETVHRLLVVFGAPADRIAVEAAGDADPADTSDTPRGWAKNRRVQLLWR